MTLALDIQNISKAFKGTPAVDALTLTVAAGQLHVLLGQNGAGKTTTLRMICGLLKPDTGTLRVLGHDIVEELEKAKQRMAYLPDEPQLYDKLTALEYLDFIAGLWSLPAGYQTTAAELLRWLDMYDKRDSYCESYSRGMKQKLVLAGALLHDPDLLMLDEPLTGLDVVAARHVKDVLIERVKQGKTVLLTTHILETAERLLQETGGTISVIAKGKLLAQGSLESLLDSTGALHLEAAFLKLVR